MAELPWERANKSSMQISMYTRRQEAVPAGKLCQKTARSWLRECFVHPAAASSVGYGRVLATLFREWGGAAEVAFQ